MRSGPEPGSSVGGGAVAGRDPWAGFGAGPASATRSPSSTGNGSAVDDDRPVADLARRLQDRVDGQEALLDRLTDLAQQADDRARLAELRDVTRRLRRDSEALLLLCGSDPGVHRGTPHTVPVVLGDAMALVEEPSRVALRTAPPVTLSASAAVELRHLVAELVDEATAASPGARIEVGGRLESDGGLVVEVLVAGRGWTDALGGARGSAVSHGGSRVAERLAKRSTGGIRLERPFVDGAEGLVATLHCPPALVTGGAGIDPWHLGGSSLSTADPSSLLLSSAVPGRTRSSGDELFGPLPAAVGAVGTPIFEAVASAWFRDDERGPTGDDWNSPQDREWRAAAARATRTDTPPTTASGLPRRSPGDRLVPPPRSSPPPARTADERVPERVRDRLSTYQRGLRQGRHRAAEPQTDSSGEPSTGAWTAEGW
jgi:hypothetical protein